jgi:hypothetical protein
LEILAEYSEKNKDIETNKRSMLKPYIILAFIWSVLIALTTTIVALTIYVLAQISIPGMSNPPMQWGYPRTVEGFIHAFTRGQYEKANPTDIIHDPMRFITQLGMLGRGIVEEFNWVYAFLLWCRFSSFSNSIAGSGPGSLASPPFTSASAWCCSS